MEQLNQPQGLRQKRQEDPNFCLAAFNPKPGVYQIACAFLVFSLIFLGCGFWIYTCNESVIEHEIRYDNVCQNKFRTGDLCEVTLTLDKEMVGPVFFYYKITNFYQNLRRYLKSKSIYQMQNHELAKESKIRKDCEPIVTIEDAWEGMNVAQQTKMTSYLSTINKQANEVVANPCGLIAKTFFNDTFQIDNVNLNDVGIAWKTDKDKFNRATDFNSQWIDPDDEHFIVWVRASGTPNFRKLYGRSDADIPAGTYTVKINNVYDQKKFNGEKYFVLTTSSVLGGKNPWLQYSYFGVGVMCLMISFFFCFKKKIAGDDYGIQKYD